MIADFCHRANSLSCNVGINLVYRGVEEFERLSFVLFLFHGENIAKLSRRCPISSERTEMSWARQCCPVRKRESPVLVTMAPLWRPGTRCSHYIPYNLQVISVSWMINQDVRHWGIASCGCKHITLINVNGSYAQAVSWECTLCSAEHTWQVWVICGWL